MPLQRIRDADHAGLGYARVGGDGLFEGACGEAVGCYVDDVVYI
jgi:hypothetical protein